jgi:hypothetical protein
VLREHQCNERAIPARPAAGVVQAPPGRLLAAGISQRQIDAFTEQSRRHELVRRYAVMQALMASMTRFVSLGSLTWMQVAPVSRAG